MNIRTCKHCNQKFDIAEKPKGWMANHSRWCLDNPKRSDYKNGSAKAVAAMNAAKLASGKTNQYSKARVENVEVPQSPLKGISNTYWLGRKHSEKTIQLIKEKALASKHRRLKKLCIVYNGVLLDSSWELALARRLDQLAISWYRPDPIPWVDSEGNIRNYFPDFYLPNYGIYLDPKNPYALQVQQEKINYLNNNYTNVIILNSLDKCKYFDINLYL